MQIPVGPYSPMRTCSSRGSEQPGLAPDRASSADRSACARRRGESKGLEADGLAPVDVEGEARRARLELGTIAVTELVSPGAATLDSIIRHLHEDNDILYLVAHGALFQREPMLWLENEDGGVARVPGATSRVASVICRSGPGSSSWPRARARERARRDAAATAARSPRWDRVWPKSASLPS